jgi:hypothetical protein
VRTAEQGDCRRLALDRVSALPVTSVASATGLPCCPWAVDSSDIVRATSRSSRNKPRGPRPAEAFAGRIRDGIAFICGACRRQALSGVRAARILFS